MTIIFGLSVVTLLYIYFGYPLLVGVLAPLFGRLPKRADYFPKASLLIPAYNEEDHIREKIENSLALDYPREALDIVVASDGSTDATNAITEGYAAQGVRLIALPENVGKASMLLEVVPQLAGEVLVFSDASSMLEADALKVMMANFADPTVGCVSGSYRLEPGPREDMRAEGEGLYWKYETWIKQQESRLHSILGAHGAFYAIRRELFPKLDPTHINDDYLIAMAAVERGLRAVYEPAARSWEREAASVQGEFARRRRIAVGNCQQIVALKHLLNPRKGWIAFCFFSHKVLRTAAPLFMLAALPSALGLPRPWDAVAFGGQALFYMLAVTGYAFQRDGVRVGLLTPILYFCMGNLAMLAGLWRFCFSRRPHVWERARK